MNLGSFNFEHYDDGGPVLVNTPKKKIYFHLWKDLEL